MTESISLDYQKALANPIIVALDKAGKDGAIEIVRELGRSVWGFKLGALLLDPKSPHILEMIRDEIGSVNLFVDLQFTGTPEFVGEAIAEYLPYYGDIRYIVVSAVSGRPGIRRAVEACHISHVVVGSVLDSLPESEVHDIFGPYSREELALRFARMAKDMGARGFYCSVKDLEFLSQYEELKDFPKIVYGVRPNWHKDAGTHQYTMTPAEAIRCGAMKFVIGAPIREAENKQATVMEILKEVQAAKKESSQ